MILKRPKEPELMAVLADACVQNQPLGFRVIGEKSKTEYKSRFLGIDRSGTEPRLVIEAATLRGGVVAVRPGEGVKVSFSHNGRTRTFMSEVVGRSKFQLNPQLIVPSLELLIPENLSPWELRGYYRLSLSDASPIEVKISIFSEEESKPRRVRAREKGILSDVGGGGLGFRIPEGRSLLLGVGRLLSLSFLLDSEEEPAKLLGRICFSLRHPELREVFYGVQFVETEASIKYKQAIDRILRYIAQSQREKLQNRIRVER